MRLVSNLLFDIEARLRREEEAVVAAAPAAPRRRRPAAPRVRVDAAEAPVAVGGAGGITLNSGHTASAIDELRSRLLMDTPLRTWAVPSGTTTIHFVDGGSFVADGTITEGDLTPHIEERPVI